MSNASIFMLSLRITSVREHDKGTGVDACALWAVVTGPSGCRGGAGEDGMGVVIMLMHCGGVRLSADAFDDSVMEPGAGHRCVSWQRKT